MNNIMKESEKIRLGDLKIPFGGLDYESRNNLQYKMSPILTGLIAYNLVVVTAATIFLGPTLERLLS
jgi:hypothetical protein